MTGAASEADKEAEGGGTRLASVELARLANRQAGGSVGSPTGRQAGGQTGSCKQAGGLAGRQGRGEALESFCQEMETQGKTHL